jgi:ubiquinone/menaquinone biosynthesis C-methylase UbiE
MAFSGYPDANAAINEIHRVLAPGGRLVMIDVNYPPGWNPIGFLMACIWKWSGDLLRNMSRLMEERGFDVSQKEIGGLAACSYLSPGKRLKYKIRIQGE